MVPDRRPQRRLVEQTRRYRAELRPSRSRPARPPSQRSIAELRWLQLTEGRLNSRRKAEHDASSPSADVDTGAVLRNMRCSAGSSCFRDFTRAPSAHHTFRRSATLEQGSLNANESLFCGSQGRVLNGRSTGTRWLLEPWQVGESFHLKPRSPVWAAASEA